MTFNRSIGCAAVAAAALLLTRPLLFAAAPHAPLALPGMSGSVHIQRLAHGKNFDGDWKVDVSPDDDARRSHAQEFHDVLTFHGDQFSSRELQKHGFDPCHYDEDTRIDGPAQFTAKVHSKNEGEADWHGTRDADQFTGTLVWTRANGDVLNYTFTLEN
jgi:hypothetical protein